MGIKGLWREVTPICRSGHVSQFRGLRVGVDAYCWLHRAVIACALPLATGKPCDQYLSFMMSRVELLLRYGVTPVMVFDGDSMPMKKATDKDRKQRRHVAKLEGEQLLAQGALEDAARMFEKSLEVSTELSYAVMQVLKDRGIECLVAPFEADAQLGYLAKEGYISAVVTEDSDLMVYHCSVILAKMDGNGNCDVLHIRDLPSLPQLHSLSYESFVVACILSGCDYLASLPNIGIKTAVKLASQCKSIPLLMNCLITQYGFTSRELQTYEEALHQAYYCFAHHLVFDPIQKRVVPFRSLPDGVTLRNDLLGARWEDDVARHVCAEGVWDPTTLAPYLDTHRADVVMYFRRTKKGQTALTSYLGFTMCTSAKVTVALDASAAAAASNTASWGGSEANTHKSRAVAELGFGYVGGESRRYGSQQAGSNRRSSLVVSKYFAVQRDGVISASSSSSEVDEDEGVQAPAERREQQRSPVTNESDSGSSGSSGKSPAIAHQEELDAAVAAFPIADQDPAGSGVLRGVVPGDDDDCDRELLYHKSSSSRPSRSFVGLSHAAPLASAALRAPPPFVSVAQTKGAAPSSTVGTCLTAASSHSRHSPNASSDGSQSLSPPTPALVCPYGYAQCGKAHSIFYKCFEGKAWPRGGDGGGVNDGTTHDRLAVVDVSTVAGTTRQGAPSIAVETPDSTTSPQPVAPPPLPPPPWAKRTAECRRHTSEKRQRSEDSAGAPSLSGSNNTTSRGRSGVAASTGAISAAMNARLRSSLLGAPEADAARSAVPSSSGSSTALSVRLNATTSASTRKAVEMFEKMAFTATPASSHGGALTSRSSSNRNR